MEKPIGKSKLPRTDSVRELAEFWDSHDLTDFSDELEDTEGSVFQHEPTVHITLQFGELEAVKRIAKAKGTHSTELIRQWILEHIKAS